MVLRWQNLQITFLREHSTFLWVGIWSMVASTVPTEAEQSLLDPRNFDQQEAGRPFNGLAADAFVKLNDPHGRTLGQTLDNWQMPGGGIWTFLRRRVLKDR